MTSSIAGTFWLLISLARDIKSDMHAIAEIIRIKGSLFEIKLRFSNFIEIHSNAKQLSSMNFKCLKYSKIEFSSIKTF